MIINNLTRESAAHRFLIKIETDVDHICKMKSTEWEKSLDCGAFIFEVRDSIDGFLSDGLKTCKRNEKRIIKDCLVEIRKILRLLQLSYRAKVFSSITIHSMVSDMRNYIRETRTQLAKMTALN